MAKDGPRDRLLAATLDYVSAHGVSDLSLRELAAAIGTSHRMLLYHFGSKEQLLVAVVQAVEEGQRRRLADLGADPSLSPVDAMRQMWHQLADPARWANEERLFFELYAQALLGRPGTTGLLDGVVDLWVDLGARQLVRWGASPDTARADARLGLAVVRGLLLDLLATGDRAGVDAALDRYLELIDPVVGPRPAAPAP